MALNGIDDSWIESKIAPESFETVPPSVGRLDSFIDDNGPYQVNHLAVATLSEQRAVVCPFNEIQQAKFNQVPMDRHESERPGFDPAGQWIQIEDMVPGLFADIFPTKLQGLADPASGVSSNERSPPLGRPCFRELFRHSDV